MDVGPYGEACKDIGYPNTVANRLKLYAMWKEDQGKMQYKVISDKKY